jgi:hypothetical protein
MLARNANVEISEQLLKLLDHPSKALIVVGAILSYFAIKKSNQLMDKIFSIYEDHKKDIKEINTDLKNQFVLMKADIQTLRTELNYEIDTITKLIHDSHLVYDKDFNKYFQELGKVKKLETEIEASFGKIILIDQNQKLNENKLNEVHDELSKFKTVLSFHNSQIKKHLK